MAVDVVKRCRVKSGFDLDRHDPDATFGWETEWAERRTGEVLQEVADLQERLFAEAERALLIVLQGMDGSGKDSTIRHVLSRVNVSGVHVHPFGVPSEEEAAHDFLWRAHRRTPGKGMIGVFNRSYYEDVLVVRVKQLQPQRQWEPRYRHIRDFEAMLADEGTAVVKLFLHISNEEQRKQLQERVDDPSKRWKFRRGDLDDRKLWDDFVQAYADALRRTSRAEAPWYVVPGNHRWVRNLVVAEILRHHLKQIDPQLPPPDPGIDRLQVP